MAHYGAEQIAGAGVRRRPASPQVSGQNQARPAACESGTSEPSAPRHRETLSWRVACRRAPNTEPVFGELERQRRPRRRQIEEQKEDTTA
jgi:hypothetical protein